MDSLFTARLFTYMHDKIVIFHFDWLLLNNCDSNFKNFL
jgi:hypothetical protein